MSELRTVLVTGIGVVSAAGEGTARLAEAVSARRPVRAKITAFEPAEGEPTCAAETPEFDLARHVPSVKSYIDRTSALALAASKMALDDAGLSDGSSRAGEIGLAYGTQWGCLDSMELFFGKLSAGDPHFAPPLPFSHSYANSPASVVAIELKLRGDHRVYSTGRLSGAWALLGASDTVGLGAAEAILCAASDSFTRPAFRHYLANNRLLPDDAPSDDRGRFLLGEGAACLVLEAEEAVGARGAEAKAALLGAGTARGKDRASALEDAARDALERAGVKSGDVKGFVRNSVKSFIGAAPTAAGADAEIAAAARLAEVPEEALRETFLSVGLVLGETMGASGALAAALGCARVEKGPALVMVSEGGGGGAALAQAAVAFLIGPVPQKAGETR